MTREEWKVVYRLLRVARRECNKAADDMLTFGTGCVYISDIPDYIKYIPFESLKLVDET